MTLEAALAALTTDANRWDDVSDALAGARDAATRLTLPASTFSFAGGEAATAYEAVRAHVRALLDGGVQETAGAAQALREVRRTYEETDEAARAGLSGRWAPQ